MAKLGISDIKKLSDLSKIELTEIEESEYFIDLNNILAHVSEVSKFESEARVEFEFDSQVRGDVENILDFDKEIMMNNIASKSSDNYVKVSKVIDKTK